VRRRWRRRAHVAFQTGHAGGITGRLFGRFDLAVAVFFALSGFLLWRATPRRPEDYGRPRRGTTFGRASCASCRLPGCGGGDSDAAADARADLTVWLANLSLTQIMFR